MFCDEDQGEKKESAVCHAFIIFIYKQRPSFELGNCDKATETCSENVFIFLVMGLGFLGKLFLQFLL